MDVALTLKLRTADNKRIDLSRAHDAQKQSKLHQVLKMMVRNFFRRYQFE
jgi:hypothetical protein